MFDQNLFQSFEPHENPFETVMVDVTHRCNMNCANCYLPDRTPPDMDIKRLEDCISQFPKRTNIRIAGAEPTLRSDLPEIISMVRRCGHPVVLLTNGLRLARENYVKELKDAGLRHVYISLNGADNDNWYERIDNLRCASKKMAAVENALEHNLILNTGTILVRGLNEGAVDRIYQKVKSHNPRHALLRFKNIGALGRYDEQNERKNLTMDEMLGLFVGPTGQSVAELSEWNKIKGFEEENSRLFPANTNDRHGNGIWFKVANWQADDLGLVDGASSRRGRITAGFKVSPFFESFLES